MLTEDQSKFLARRRIFAKTWPLVGVILILLVVVFYGFLFWRSPLLVNPYHVMARVKADNLPQELALTMAMVMPLVVLWTGVLIIAFLLISFSMSANERKLIQIIDGYEKNLSDEDAMPPSDDGEEAE